MKEQKDFLNLKKSKQKSYNSACNVSRIKSSISNSASKEIYKLDFDYIKDIEEDIQKLKIYLVIFRVSHLNFKINKTIVHFSKSEEIIQKYYESNHHLIIEKIYYELCINSNPNLKIAKYVNSILERDVINPFISSRELDIETYKISNFDIKKLLFSGHFSDLALRNLAQSLPLDPGWRSLIHEYFFYKNTI